MPVVALATTEVPDAVPAGCGVVSNDLDVLARGGGRASIADPRRGPPSVGARRHGATRSSGSAWTASWSDGTTCWRNMTVA